MNHTPEATSLSTAQAAIERGWAPLPIPLGSKAPRIKDWPTLRFDSTVQLAEHFEDRNVGLILGAASGGLVDVDLDCPEALALAPMLLPHTPMRHGRPSSPESHFWYQVDRPVSTERFQDPTPGAATEGRGVLVELRGTGGQTLIPPSVHPCGERLSWSEGDLRKPREIASEALKLRVRVMAAASLLTRYWPASGGRHDASLALAGGLREQIVITVREWLDLPTDEEAEESTGELPSRVELGDLVEHGVPDPEWVMPGVFYSGQLHWVHGEPGSGKTILTLALTYQLAAEGKRIMWIDEEAGKVQTARRLQGLGADPDVLRERFRYYARPGLSLDPASLDALLRTVEGYQPDLIVFDSVADVLGASGLDEDSNADVTTWAKKMLEPLKFDYGAALIAIDHVTKSKEGRGGYARGAGAKKSKTDAAWKVVKASEFSATRMGIIRMEADKDRDGWLPSSLAFRIGGRGDSAIHIERMEAAEVGGNVTPSDDIERSVVDFLRLNADSERGAMTTKEVRDALPRRGEDIVKALNALLSKPETGVRMTELGRAKRWWFEDLSGSVEVDFRLLEES
ncbi:MAG: AAA family ATPase [Thioalkalivibrio sp.]|nr:AAA family ATPase [Thioalkalivibrio sp.]